MGLAAVRKALEEVASDLVARVVVAMVAQEVAAIASERCGRDAMCAETGTIFAARMKVGACRICAARGRGCGRGYSGSVVLTFVSAWIGK
jgi:hypothetical protein